MENPRTRTAGLVVLALSALMASAAVAGEVSLTGTGSVRYEPDSARLRFTATAEHPLATRASEQVQTLMEQWRREIEPWRDRLEDYSDASLSLYTRTLPAREPDGEARQSAVANQSVSFSIHDLSLLNPLLETARKLGLTYSLSPGNFYHSAQEKLERQALAAAIADARSRCEFVAAELGQRCGEVVSMNINSGSQPYPVMMMAEPRRSRDAVSEPGIRELTVTVSATFKLD